MYKCPCNAQYTSKVIQNEVIDIIGGIVRESITKNLNFSIIADELTDPISNQQVLCMCLRYLINIILHDIPAICESLLICPV